MTEIVETIDISRSPQDVFSFVNDSSLFPRWKGDVVSVRRLDPDPVTVGSKATVIRRLGHRELPGDEEIIEMSRPATSTARATRSLVTTIARGTIEPLDGGERSRVTIALTFAGMGSGRRSCRSSCGKPGRNTQKLKEGLDPGAIPNEKRTPHMTARPDRPSPDGTDPPHPPSDPPAAGSRPHPWGPAPSEL
jgi:uncharacterized protein YndB with AHSA1/START domain